MSSSMATHSAASAPILAEIREQIQQLFLTPLSDNNMQVMQEKVQILHRSSFYLEELSYPIEPQQLPGALRVAQSHVRLLLNLMKMLLEAICCCRQALQGFLQQIQTGPVDSDLINHARTTLRQVRKHLHDFKTGAIRNLGILNLEKHPLLHSAQLSVPPLTALLFYKLPVVFDRFKSHAKCTTAHLVWSLHGGQCPEPKQLYEVSSKILHPCVGEQGQGEQFTVKGLCFTINNLTPDRFYELSVKYINTFKLVFSEWKDTLILKTCPLK